MDRELFLQTLLFLQRIAPEKLLELQSIFTIQTLFEGECCFEVDALNVIQFNTASSLEHRCQDPWKWCLQILISVDKKQSEPAAVYFKLDEHVYFANHSVISQLNINSIHQRLCIVISWPGVDMRLWLKDSENCRCTKKLNFVMQTMQSVLTAEVLCLKDNLPDSCSTDECSVSLSYRNPNGDVDYQKLVGQVELFLHRFTSILDHCEKLLDPRVSEVNKALALTTCLHIEEAIHRSKQPASSTKQNEDCAAINHINKLFLESLISSEEYCIIKECFDIYLKEHEKKLSDLLDKYYDPDPKAGISKCSLTPPTNHLVNVPP